MPGTRGRAVISSKTGGTKGQSNGRAERAELTDGSSSTNLMQRGRAETSAGLWRAHAPSWSSPRVSWRVSPAARLSARTVYQNASTGAHLPAFGDERAVDRDPAQRVALGIVGLQAERVSFRKAVGISRSHARTGSPAKSSSIPCWKRRPIHTRTPRV